MKLHIYLSLALILVFSLNLQAFHGDLDIRIADVTEEIIANPDSSFLYLKRGELYYQHEEYTKALQDFQNCKTLKLSNGRLIFGMAEACFKLQKFEDALAYLDQLLILEDNNVLPLRWKGHTLMAIENYSQAAAIYEDVIQYANQAFTENYLEASIAWEKSSTAKGIQ